MEPEQGPPLVIGLRLGALRARARPVRGLADGGEPDGRARVGLDRAGALARSLLSTHPLAARHRRALHLPARARVRRASNTFPVLATPADDTVLGAAIVLPDHPQIAPESRGGLFDSTEIEEALLLHVQVLSDEERARDRAPGPGGAGDDRPSGGARRRRTSSRCTGASTLRDPHRRDAAAGRDRPWLPDPRPRGEESADVGGSALPARRQGRDPAAGGRRHARADARRADRDDRADLHRLRRQDAPRRHDRRRPRSGADARDRPVPVLLCPRGGGDPL